MRELRPVLVTGGAGFIGSNFILELIARGIGPVVNLDKLTYAGNARNLSSHEGGGMYTLVRGDICDLDLVGRLLTEYRPWAVVHFAAESHVDRSIAAPDIFIRTNVEGTFTLLRAIDSYLRASDAEVRQTFRFLHVSTDEVFGSLGSEDPPFCEQTAYAPNSPYAASKAASDHLVRAWVHTFDLPAIITNCSNNYGPYQLPEKLIPLMITNALAGIPLPVYGDGLQVRDWLYVSDHCSALRAVLKRGRVGTTYNIGGGNQRSNLEVVRLVCEVLDTMAPESKFRPHIQLLQHVPDRMGHDRRYAIDARKIGRELDWRPEETFESGLRKTVAWYLANPAWVRETTSEDDHAWVKQKYGHRGDPSSVHLPLSLRPKDRR